MQQQQQGPGSLEKVSCQPQHRWSLTTSGHPDFGWLTTGHFYHITLLASNLNPDMQFEHLLRLLIFTSAPSLATFWPPPSSASSRRAITSKSLATYTWPDHPVKRGGVSDAKALVFISHGYAEHLHPYYDSLGKACAARGLICWGHDHIGHGTSPGRRTEVDGMENYIDPLVEACKAKRKEHPGGLDLSSQHC